MLPNIEVSKQTLSVTWPAMIISYVGIAAIFTLPLFTELSVRNLLILLTIAAVTGLALGIYLQFRSVCGSATAIFNFFNALFVLEIMMGGGGAALALKIAGRPDLCWPVFYANCLAIIISLLAGIALEARALGLCRAAKNDRWKKKLDTYIDYVTHQVRPALLSDLHPPKKSRSFKSSMWIIAAGGVNLPILFDIYGGGRENAVLVAAPVLIAVFVYINLKSYGPGALRLWLLRKLEKAAGRRFINADYEQIQALRRTFFLSRWLMKDYAAPQPVTSVQKTTKQPKRHRK